MARAFVVMGVSGCGKSTLGRLIADRLQVRFLEGDDFHPPCNVAKMAAGVRSTMTTAGRGWTTSGRRFTRTPAHAASRWRPAPR
ncbi:shikimate kinase [Methylocella sp.]|uniref:shikimate kinase n=1 Tax=Methylocella sp. TaxID=1978226 RepID=UPI003C2012E9